MLGIDEFKANENMDNGRFFNILNVISIQNSKILKKKGHRRTTVTRSSLWIKFKIWQKSRRKKRLFSLNCFQPCHLLHWVELVQLGLNQFAKTVKTPELKVKDKMSDSLIHC